MYVLRTVQYILIYVGLYVLYIRSSTTYIAQPRTVTHRAFELKRSKELVVQSQKKIHNDPRNGNVSNSIKIAPQNLTSLRIRTRRSRLRAYICTFWAGS